MKPKKPLFTPSITLFAMPMGLIGLGNNGLHYAQGLSLDAILARGILYYGYIVLAIVGIPYFYTLIKEWFQRSKQTSLLSEWQHPFQLSLFPSITLTLMLFFLSLWQLQWWQDRFFWGFLAVLFLHSILFVYMVSRWIFDARVELDHLKPTWFILLSGNFVSVISGLSILPASWHEFLWFYFSATFFIWFTLVFSLFYQLIFIKPLSQRMRPTLFIFLAPPSLGTVASILLFPSTQPSLVAWTFYSFASFILFVWLFSVAHFRKSELSMVSWSYVYPLAAYGLAGQYMAEVLQAPILWWWSGVIFLVITGFVVLLSSWLFKEAYTRYESIEKNS